jgi:hypothetical protein
MVEARRMGKSELFAHFPKRFGGRDFGDEIAERLTKAGLKFQRDPGIGGLRPDFLVIGPQGQRVVIEAKAWNPRGGNTARAIEQATHYQSLSGADKAFVVLPESRGSFAAKGVVSAEALVPAVTSFLEQRRQRPAAGTVKSKARGDKRDKSRKESRQATIFAAMPFDRGYDDTYFVAMSYAAERVDAACTRVDREEFTGDIVEEIKRLIKTSVAVVVDLSEGKPNVLYEAGFAHALAKPTVHICSTSMSELPFDVRNWNTLKYRRGQTIKLREPLARRLEAIIG